MRGFFNYFIVVFLLVIFFRFFGFIMGWMVRFWFIVLPVLLLLYYINRRKIQQKTFRKKTGLDPKDEVHLKEEPTIEEED